MRILVVDDENDIRQVLKLMLESHGHEVIGKENGRQAVEYIRDDLSVDLCIMDIMMPEMTGVEATVEIRKFSAVPILFLTARSFESDKEEAYLAGGDDDLVKPFSAPELIRKVDALTRRYNTYGAKDVKVLGQERLECGVTVSIESRTVSKNGTVIDLRDKEFDVLLYLVENRGRTVSPDELYEAVWGEMPLPSSGNNVTVHILNLRRRLEDTPSSPKVIRTVWGRGYQID